MTGGIDDFVEYDKETSERLLSLSKDFVTEIDKLIKEK